MPSAKSLSGQESHLTTHLHVIISRRLCSGCLCTGAKPCQIASPLKTRDTPTSMGLECDSGPYSRTLVIDVRNTKSSLWLDVVASMAGCCAPQAASPFSWGRPSMQCHLPGM